MAKQWITKVPAIALCLGTQGWEPEYQASTPPGIFFPHCTLATAVWFFSPDQIQIVNGHAVIGRNLWLLAAPSVKPTGMLIPT
jgi:hypothetical protein